MARLTIELPDDLSEKAQARATAVGHRSVEAYLQNLLRDDVETAAMEAPDTQTFRNATELDAMLRTGHDSGPAVELTDADWERKRRRLTEAYPDDGRGAK